MKKIASKKLVLTSAVIRNLLVTDLTWVAGGLASVVSTGPRTCSSCPHVTAECDTTTC
jgi:hypothetical protein